MKDVSGIACMKHFNTYLTIIAIFYSTLLFANSADNGAKECISKDYLPIPDSHWLIEQDATVQTQVLGYLSYTNFENCTNHYDVNRKTAQADVVDKVIGVEKRIALENEFKNIFDVIKTLVYIKKIKGEPLGELVFYKNVISEYEKELIEGFEEELASYVVDDPEELKCMQNDRYLPIPASHWLIKQEVSVQFNTLSYLSRLNLTNCINDDLNAPSLKEKSDIDATIGQQKRLELENEFQGDFNVLKTLVYIKKITNEPLGSLKGFKREILTFEKELLEGFEEELNEPEESVATN